KPVSRHLALAVAPATNCNPRQVGGPSSGTPTRKDFSAGDLDQRGRTHATADAHGHHAVAATAALELAEDGGDQTRTGDAERVSQGDGATVGVHLVLGDAQLAHAVEALRGEGLVELEDVDVVDGQLVLRQQLADRGHRTD